MEKSSPWACPPLNLLNWNMAWTWRVHAPESAPLTSWMSVMGVGGQEMRLLVGQIYQMARSNK